MARAVSDENQMRLVRLQEHAREAVQLGTEWLTSAEHAELAHWKDQGLIFAISRDGEDLFPRYALGADHRPFRVMAEMLALLKEYSSENLASWFESTSSVLGGARPREVPRQGTSGGARCDRC